MYPTLSYTLKQAKRLCAAWVAMLYLLMSMLAPFQHTESLTGEIPLGQRTAARSIGTSASWTHTELQATSHQCSPSDHCNACDWVANQLSPALPITTYLPTQPLTPRVVTQLPRYLSRDILHTSARAPPTA